MKILIFLSIVLGFFSTSAEFSQGANLAIRKSGPSSANPGELITYTITYSNSASTLESNVVITDYLPDAANCTYYSSSPSGVYNAVLNTITWNSTLIPGLAHLDAGSGENTIQVTLRVGKLGTGIDKSSEGYYLNASSATLSSYADIKSDQTIPSISSESISTIVNYDCTFKISQPGAGIKSASNSTLTYFVALTNTGNIYQKYSLTSTLFSGQYLSQSIRDINGGAISETPFVEPGGTYFFHYVLKTPQHDGTKPDQYTETKITAIPNICGDTHEAIYNTYVYGGSYNNYKLLSVYKIDTSDPIQSGSQLTYQIVICNAGDPLDNVRLKEIYPSNTSFISASTSVSSVTTGNNIWDFPLLPSGNTIIEVTLDVPKGLPNGTILNNTVEVSNEGTVYDTYTETTTVSSAPDLSITKTASVIWPPAVPKPIVNYTLTFINHGNYTASDIVIKDDYDEDYMDIDDIESGINTGDEIRWNIPDPLAPGKSGTLHYSMFINDNPALSQNASTNIINNAVISSNLSDSNDSDNSASATVNVFVLPDLKIERTADPVVGFANHSITYALSVSNVGKLNHSGSTYTVVVNLPAGTTYLSSTPVGATYNAGTVSWTISDDLPVNGSKNFTVTLDALPCSFFGAGTLINNASVYSTLYGDADNSNNEVVLITDVVDNEIPTIAPIDPVSANNDSGKCSAEVTLAVPSTADNCGILSVTNNHPSTTFPVGTTTVKWTVTDIHGNVTTANQNVIIKDVSVPVADMETLATVTGECSVIVPVPTATDNCGGTIQGTTEDALTYSIQGNYTIDWTYNDGNGNSSTQTQTVVVGDVIAPVADVAELPVLMGKYTVTAPFPTATDNCAGVITGSTSDPLTYTVQGTYIIHWTYGDGNGNTFTQTQTVVVEDTTAPDTPILADVTVGECSGTPTIPTTTDSGFGQINGTTTTSFPITTQGTTIVTWTFKDGNGNETTASQNVIVKDVTDPVADVQTLPTITGECSVTVTAPTATDNCKGSITGTTTDPLTYTAQGNYTIEWTYNDGNGNTFTQSQNVIVKDVTDPVAEVAVLPTLTGECGVTVTAPMATDNCEGSITGTTQDPTEYTQQGSYTINWTYDDGHGNTFTQSQNVIVKDVTDPVADVAVLPTLTGECGVTVIAPMATDNCKGSITGTTTDPLTYTAQGNYSILWNYDDGNGNMSTQTQTVMVDDVTDPVADVQTLPTITGECSVIVPVPTATDNCKGTIQGTTDDPTKYTQQGSYSILWTYDDGNGNMSTQTQTVMVDDVTDPVADVQTLPTITGECSVIVPVPTATDNCKGTIQGTTEDALIYSAQGTYTIHWTYDDRNGNTLTQTQTVVVDDVTPPETPVLADVIVGECGGTPPTPTTTDNCKGTVFGTTSILFPKTKQGKSTIIWSFDDGNGNVTTAYQNLIVDDVTAPIANVASLPTITGECSVTVPSPTATDNCKGTIQGTTEDPTEYTQQGTYSILWTYDDGNGNMTTQTQTVMVDDVTDPVADVQTLPTITGECSVIVPVPTATDNCEGIIQGTTEDALIYSAQGTYTIHWTYDDRNGNTSTQTQTVMVDDVTDPVADLQTLPTITGECSVIVPVPTATDNCEGIIQGTTEDALIYSAQGTYTIHWTYDDGNGNTSTQTQTVVVDDVTPPETPVLVDVIVGECNGTPPIPTTVDNCAGIVMGKTSIVFPKTKQGKSTIIWTFDDGNGNVASAYQNLIVDDTTAPRADVETLPTITGECSVTVSAPTATDYCKGSITGTTTDPLIYSAQGTYTIHWTYDDGNGNISTQTQTVMVDDITPPEITGSISVTAVEGCDFVDVTPAVNTMAGLETLGLSVSDACTPNAALYISSRDDLTGTMPKKVTRTYTITDANHNDASYIQTILLVDRQKPTIICPEDKNVMVDKGKCTASGLALGIPITSDNCSIASVSNDAPEIFPIGTTIVTWMVTDASGNITTCTQIVNVKGLPVAVDDYVSVDEDDKISGNVMENDEGLCTMSVLVKSHTEPEYGSLTIAANGNYTYTPDYNYEGIDKFTYRICSFEGNCSEATVTITIKNSNDMPLAKDDTHTIQLDLVLQGDVAENDIISGDGGNVWTIINAPVHGTISFHPDGTYTYTPSADFLGNDRFTYKLCDADGDCSQAKVSILIEDILLPNEILTPNGDDVNDTFIIVGINLYPQNKLTMYNRWGNIVYQKNNYQNEWDGSSNVSKVGSKSLPVGTYYFLVDYGKNRHKTGFVYLDR